MMMPLPKPRPIIPRSLSRPKPKWLPKVKKNMTLVAAFRCPNGGLLLCADREESYADVKREVDKIYRINLPTFQVFIAGAGPSSVVSRACSDIHNVLTQAFSDGEDMVRKHKSLIESSLRSIHENYAANLQERWVGKTGHQLKWRFFLPQP